MQIIRCKQRSVQCCKRHLLLFHELEKSVCIDVGGMGHSLRLQQLTGGDSCIQPLWGEHKPKSAVPGCMLVSNFAKGIVRILKPNCQCFGTVCSLKLVDAGLGCCLASCELCLLLQLVAVEISASSSNSHSEGAPVNRSVHCNGS